MNRSNPKILVIFLVMGLAACSLIAQYGSSPSYNLQWKVIESGGSEGDDISSANYRMSSSIGQPTGIGLDPSAATSYILYPGFRKIDLDLRYPYSWFVFGVTYASDTSWEISWSGVDTTIEDGVGWGVWSYDVQYSVGGGPWENWLIDTEDTSAVFGPEIPVDVALGEVYRFRLRAEDKARNEAPWGAPESTVVNYVIEFCVHTIAPGEPTTSANYVELSYWDDFTAVRHEDLWEGHCVEVWCAPNSDAWVNQKTTDSDTTERWVVNTATHDTLWEMDGTGGTYDAYYWHQLKPIITLDGTDATHTVETIQHDMFGPGHLETGLFGVWSEWTDYGSLLEFSDSTIGGTPPNRYALFDSTRFWDIDAALRDTIHYLAPGNLITIETNFGGDSVRVDGHWYASPRVTNWFDLSTHEIAVKDTVWISDCEIWVFDNWSDGGTRIHNVSVESDSTFIANFHREFKVEIANASGYGTLNPPVGEYWYPEGDTAEGTISPTSIGDDYLWGYIGTGSCLSGGGNNFWFEVFDCSTVDWEWINSTEPMCTVWVYSRFGHPHPPIGMYIVPRGTSIWLSVEDSTYEEGMYRYCTGWRGDGTVIPATGTENIFSTTITDNGWIVWIWDSEDLMPLVINSSPGVHGSPDPSVGMHWYPYASFVDAFVTNPDGDWWCTGFEGWGAVSTSSADSLHFNLDVPTHIDWQWEDLPGTEQETLWVFSPYGSPVPTMGMHIFPTGTHIIAYVPTPSGSHDCSGWSGTGSVPATGDTNYIEFDIDEYSTLTWQWDEVLVPFYVVNPGGHGFPVVPSAGVHWNPVGTVVDAYVTSPDGAYYCTGFTGFGDVPASGFEDSVHFTHNIASGVEWHWDSDVVFLDVAGPDYCDPTPPLGRTWHPRSSIVNAFAQDTVYVGADIRHICTGWTGDGTVVPASGDSNRVDILMSDNGSIEWIYQNGYRLTLAHAGLPAGEEPESLGVDGWYIEGDTAILMTDSVVWVGTTPYVFAYWDDRGFGAPIANPNSPITSIEMDNSYSLIATYLPGVTVHIYKAPAHTTPGWIRVDGDTIWGDHYHSLWATGTTHEIEVSDPDSTDTLRYNFDSWRDDPTAGIIRTVSPSTDVDYFADYIENHHIIVVKEPCCDTLGFLRADGALYTGTESVRQDFWWTEGTMHTLEASEPDSIANLRYHFQNWSTSDFTEFIDYGPVVVHDSITAFYTKEYYCHVVKDPLEPHGWISIDGTMHESTASVDFWAFADSSYELLVSPADTVMDSLYSFDHWDEPGFPTSNYYETPPIIAPDTFLAIYNGIRAIIRVEYGQYGAFPSESLYWCVSEGPGDLVTSGETRTMDMQDSIKIYNFSNVNVDFGLYIDEIYDTTDGWISDTIWEPGYSSAYNRFVLRARFDDSHEPPSVWWAFRDFIDISTVWASSDPSFSIFGPGGENVGHIPPNHTEMLWLQFIAPEFCDKQENTRCITLIIQAKIHLP